jgi:hypothetical protein
MLPWDATGKTGPKKPLPDVITVYEPKDEARVTEPQSIDKYGARPRPRHPNRPALTHRGRVAWHAGTCRPHRWPPSERVRAAGGTAPRPLRHPLPCTVVVQSSPLKKAAAQRIPTYLPVCERVTALITPALGPCVQPPCSAMAARGRPAAAWGTLAALLLVAVWVLALGQLAQARQYVRDEPTRRPRAPARPVKRSARTRVRPRARTCTHPPAPAPAPCTLHVGTCACACADPSLAAAGERRCADGRHRNDDDHHHNNHNNNNGRCTRAASGLVGDPRVAASSVTQSGACSAAHHTDCARGGGRAPAPAPAPAFQDRGRRNDQDCAADPRRHRPRSERVRKPPLPQRRMSRPPVATDPMPVCLCLCLYQFLCLCLSLHPGGRK